MKITRSFKTFSLFSALIALTACGGGGSSDTPPPLTQAPTLEKSSVFPQLAHIVTMGQSLGAGAESFPILSTRDTGYGNLQFSRGRVTWREQEPVYCGAPELRPAADFAFVPLIGGDIYSQSGESISNGMADHLKSAIGAVDTRFLVSYAGQGARRLRELDKRHAYASDARTTRRTAGGHYITSIDDVRRGKSEADKKGWSYGVPAITWMQGEAENDYRSEDWTAPLSRVALMDTYANDLINLKNDWNEDILAITGQKNRIPLFTYQTYGALTGQAQLVASDRDPEIIVTTPTYYTSSSLNSANGYNPTVWGNWIHIDGDSERLIGEQFAKVMHRVLVDKETWLPLRPIRSWSDQQGDTVYVQYHVPRPPLVLDTDFLPAVAGAGFVVNGGPAVTSASVVTPDTVALKLAAPLSGSGSYHIQYAADSRSTQLLALPEAILAVRAGAKWENGQESFEVVFAGDLRALIQPAMRAGVIYLQSKSEDGSQAQGVIRTISLDNQGNTVLKGAVGDLTGGVSFKAGQTATLNSIFFMGNLRDSDPAKSLNRFMTGPRTGQPYPLWNWSVAFQDLPVARK
jgi:hypothetical protein